MATWRQVLGYRNGNTRGNVRKKYLDLIRVAHTNKRGGSHEKAVEIISAWTQAQEFFRLNNAKPRASPTPPPPRPAAPKPKESPRRPAPPPARPPRPTPSPPAPQRQPPPAMKYMGDWKRVIGFQNGNSKNVARKKAMIAWMANSHKAGAKDYFTSAWANAEQYFRFVGDGPRASRQSFYTQDMDWEPTTPPRRATRSAAAAKRYGGGPHKAGVRKARATQRRR